jgi:type I restriction enzyme S subunit
VRLPESWTEATVRIVVDDLQPGFAQKPGEETDGTTPQIRTHNVTPEGKITLEGIKHISASAKELGRYSLTLGDVVFNNTNSEEWVGKTAVFDQEGEYVFSNHMTRLRVNRDLVGPEYLAGYLQLLWSKGFTKTRAKRWVSQAGIESNSLASFNFPLPTLPEQQRIVDVLRQAERVDALAKTAGKLIDELAKQRFAEMFGHPAENPNGFDTAAFHSFGALERGISKHRPRDASHLFGGSYPFIQTGDVSNAGDWITSYKSTYSEAGLEQSRLWPKGTLCITIAANIAKAAILEFDACFPDSVVGFTPNEGISNEFVLYCLRFYQEYFEHRAPKSAQMNINLDTLRTLRMPKPPEALQFEFSQFVHEIRVLSQVVTAQANRRKELLRDIIVSAFTGELTAKWREHNYHQITTAAFARDALLRERGAKLTKPTPESKPISTHVAESEHPARHWLYGELSEFQRQVLAAFSGYPEQPLLSEDPEVFAKFCDDDAVSERLQAFGPALNNRIRRTLSQLAALGLIAKVTLPKQNLETGEREYLKAFRPLRSEEYTRLNDVAQLRKVLTAHETMYYFTVLPDYETSEHAGAGGMFQVAALDDENGKDRTDLVDQGKHYNTIDELADDIALRLGVSANQVELEAV